MGVMTSKDMALKNQKIETEGEVNLASPSTRKLVMCARFPGAPVQGKCNAAFFHEGESYQVELVDQLYFFKDDSEKRSLLKSMLKAGFVIADYFEGEAPKVEKKVRRFSIRYGHPDNEPDEPKTGTVAFKVGRGKSAEEFSFKLDEFGTLTTDDARVQRHLEKLGWAEIEREEIEDDESAS